MQSTPKRVLFLCLYVVLLIRKPYIKDRRERNEHLIKRETIDFMQSGGVGGVGRMEIYLVGAGVGEPCGVRGMRAYGAREGQSGEQRAEAEGRTEQPTTARR